MANNVAYGFTGLAHLANERVTTVGVEQVWDAIARSAELHSRVTNQMLASIVERTTAFQERIYLAGSGTLQPIDEWGNPVPTRAEGYYDVAYPLQMGGDAFGWNRVSYAKATVAEANRLTLEAMRKDADWMRRHMLAALFDNASYTFNDTEHGALTVQPLANNDSVTYLRRDGSSATDDHYLAQTAAIDDSNNPFPTIYQELVEHPVNAAPFVVYTPTNLVASIEALATFNAVKDADVVPGTGSDYVPAGGYEDIRLFGDEVLGKVGHVWVVEWASLPDNYMLGFAMGASPAVLAMREDPEQTLQGLFLESDTDGNLRTLRLIRRAGFGVRNRVGAVVYQIGAASYSVPSGYDAPLAV